MLTGRTWVGVALGLAMGAALGAVLLVTRGATPRHQGHGATPVPAGSVLPAPGPGEVDLGAERSNAIVRATRAVAPAVVAVNVVQQQTYRTPQMEMLERFGLVPRRDQFRYVQNLGSGVIVSADGLVVTNNHVVENAIQVLVTLSDGRRHQAVVLDRVERYDLAVLRIQAENLPVASLAHSDSLQIGEWAIAIGSPYGYLLADTQPTVTVGVISATNRDIKSQRHEVPYLGMIQTDAAINPGNSGGPLVNTRGEVVGINTFIFSDDGGGSVGLGFAVPASRVAAVIDEILTYGHYREARVGLSLRALDAVDVMSLRLTDPVGAYVEEVEADSAAWRAGLRQGDIIREIEGLRLDQSDAIYRFYYNARVGDRMRFKAERDGRIFDGEIVLAEE